MKGYHNSSCECSHDSGNGSNWNHNGSTNKGADKCLQLRMNRERGPHMVDIMNWRKICF